MTPDDPRHGTNAGYQAHRRDGEDPCEPCTVGRFRASKQTNLDRLRGVRTRYSGAEVLEVLEPWLALGLSSTALATAAGMEAQRGGLRLVGGGPVLRRTFTRLTSITEDAIPDNALVYADLTRQRIFSLMAAGHPLVDMPIQDRGTWRYRRSIRVSLARTVRDYYQDTEFTDGRSLHTRNQARNAGHRPPAAWDDPGTLAWPLGATSTITVDTDLDESLILRALDGDRTAARAASHLERVEIVARWRATGRPVNELERMTGWQPQRYRVAEDVAS